MPNEQEITVRVKVPEGEYCFEDGLTECRYIDWDTSAQCEISKLELEGIYPEPGEAGQHDDSDPMKLKKSQPCHDACKRGKGELTTYTISGGLGYLVEKKKPTCETCGGRKVINFNWKEIPCPKCQPTERKE